MSNKDDKFKSSRRRQKDENAVKRQTKIAQSHRAPIDTPHKFAKHHAMNCGVPNCVMCSNPRRIFKERTIQEQRMMQDVDNLTNGENHDRED
jgi:plasmid replication initiation protein